MATDLTSENSRGVGFPLLSTAKTWMGVGIPAVSVKSDGFPLQVFAVRGEPGETSNGHERPFATSVL